MISIITPTNKLVPTFEHTVLCVLNQTYKDFEWVILDNSVDGYVKEVLETYRANYPQYSDMFNKIKVYREYNLNKPVGYYKNKCVEYTTCKANEYVLVYDHDDFMVNTTLEDIAGCDRKYKEKIDYITGDLLFADCFDSTGTLKICDELEYDGMRGLNKKMYRVEAPIKMGLATLKDCLSCTVYGYDFNQFMTILIPHPRAMKKHILETPLFEFYEGQQYEEDGVQITYAPLMLNIGWIARPTVIYAVHFDENNNPVGASKRGFKNLQDRKKHHEIINARCLAFTAFNQFYKGEQTYREFYRYEDFLNQDGAQNSDK